MNRTLYLLDGMALVYRAHFALMRTPTFNAKGQNTSALLGFANVLLDLIKTRQPTHWAIAFDTAEPTERHRIYPEYKAHRDEIPEDIVFALPQIDRLAAAMRVPVFRNPGYEADDIIGTLARRAAEAGYEVFMVTPDKDFAQLVTEHVRILKPGRSGDDVELLGPADVCAQWQVHDPVQVIDVLALWGDASDNIPGVEGFGEKTAKALIHQFGTVENLIANAAQLKGKQQERIVAGRESALLSKRLTTIDTNVPLDVAFDALAVQPVDEAALRAFFVEFEFNTLGRRVFGAEFKAGRGAAPSAVASETTASTTEAPPSAPALKTIKDVEHDYRIADTPEARRKLAALLETLPAFCFDTETVGLEPREAELVGIAFSWAAHRGWYVPVPRDAKATLEPFKAVFADPQIEKTGHNLKFDIAVLLAHGLEVAGPLFDTMVAHFLVEPDRRHGMDELSEQFLAYTPIPITALIKDEGELFERTMRDIPVAEVAEYSTEDADVTWQLRESLAPMLRERGQDRVFYDIEMPLVRVLVDMEAEGIAIDAPTLAGLSAEMVKLMAGLETEIHALAGGPFNLNSPKQLGEILFERLNLDPEAKKTKTGQYATNEQVLEALAPKHEIVRKMLEYREVTKLKSTYVDALPADVSRKTGRVHTHFSQTGAATGRLASSDPNLQNIPIRSPLGQRIREAFVARDPDHLLLAADYSQIELRVMAEVSGDPGLREAFEAGLDIHTATAARVYGVALADVTPEMRRNAKMVNFGIIYGISAFGLSQRLGIPRSESAEIIAQYFKQYGAVKEYMDRTIASCREKGYVETVTGRRRYLRDIASQNATIRNGAERMAINTPIQGTAADMIKIAMSRVHRAIRDAGLRSRLLLQVHDELVFDMPRSEEAALRTIAEREMKHAIPMSIPIVVELGTGRNWLAAH